MSQDLFSDPKVSVLLPDFNDDVRDRLLRDRLVSADHNVITYRNESEAYKRSVYNPPDLLIVDIGAHEAAGLELCRCFRGDSKLRFVWIISLIATDDTNLHIQGLDAGADICFVKPVAVAVMISQIRAILRGIHRKSTPPEIIAVSNLSIDKTRFIVIKEHNGEREAIHLPRQQFTLLHFLASRAGWVFTRADLMQQVWKRSDLTLRTVDVHVRRIRACLGAGYIETVKGIGYRFPDCSKNSNFE